MAASDTTGPITVIGNQREQERVREVVAEYEAMYRNRVTWEAHWEEVANLVIPEYRGTIRTNAIWTPGIKKTEFQFDSTAPMALTKFSAILDSLLTPRNNMYHSLMPTDMKLRKNREVMEWYEEVNRLLFRYRYRPSANFAGQNIQNYRMLGAFGNCGMFIDHLIDPHAVGFRYRSLPMGELYIKENHQGRVDGVVRAFWMTGRQILQRWADKVPPEFVERVRKAAAQAEWMYRIFHSVRPIGDPGTETNMKLLKKGMQYESLYIFPQYMKILQEGGYRTFPFAVSRYEQDPGEWYGRGPAMIVLPSIKTLNQQKLTLLKAAHRMVDPVLLTHDDGVMDQISLRPGSTNKGGVNADGRPLVHVLPTGNYQVAEKVMELEHNIINDAFLVSLFQILTESPQMTATEVIERTREKGILLAPLLGRQQTEYMEPMIEREVDLLSQLNLLPKAPAALQKEIDRFGGPEYQVQYDSPLNRAQRSDEVAGVMRTVETLVSVVNVTQNPEPMDYLDWDKITPEVAAIQAVPMSWMRSDEDVQKLRQQRAKNAERQQQAAEAPGQAALLKAGQESQSRQLVRGLPNPAAKIIGQNSGAQ